MCVCVKGVGVNWSLLVSSWQSEIFASTGYIIAGYISSSTSDLKTMGDTVSGDWLETVILRHQREKSISKVLETHQEECVKKGDNYASDISRVTMKVLLGSGESTTRGVIVKMVPVTEHRARLINQWGIFKREIKMYNEILPVLSEVLKQTKNYHDPLWGSCLYNRPYDLLVLEDLQEYGFTMQRRIIGLDFEHAKLAVRELARFHAASVILKDRGVIEPGDFDYALLKTTDAEMMQTFHDRSFETITKVIEDYWGPEWKSYAEGLRKHKGVSIKKWKEAMIVDQNDFNVLNHGDYWLNNMMFREMEHANRPSAIRMIDFQMTFYNSPVFDWLYFTNSSLAMDVRRDKYDDLMDAYLEALKTHLEAVGVEESRIPTPEAFREKVKNKSIFGLYIAVFMMPVMKTDPEDVMDIEDILKKVEKKEEIDVNMRPYMGKSFTETLQILLPEYRKLGLI